MSLNYKTPDYFHDFQCLGGDCPDTCCQHWEVKLDRRHYDLLREKMAQQEDSRALFERHIQINEQPVTGDHDYAFIRMGEDDRCPMLDANALCRLHAQHGIEPLGDVCAFYPRVISRCNNDMELSGALSCPEVARRCLSSEHPHRLLRFQVSQLPRSKDYPIQRELPQNPFDYYARDFPAVRQTLLELASREERPLNARLYELITLAHTISRYYHRDCKTREQARLERDLADAREARRQQKIAAFVNADENVDPLALLTVRAILTIKIQHFPQERLSRMAASAFAGDAESLSVEELQQAYKQRRDTIPESLQKRIDAAFTRYLCNCLFREWYFTMPDSFTCLQMLLIRLAMLRYLLYGQPRFESLLALHDGAGEQERQRLRAELDAQLVDLIYNFARGVDQNLSFLQLIYTAISEQGMFNFDYSLAFSRF